MELIGKVISGKNDFENLEISPWHDYYKSKTRLNLEKGSLNLKLDEEISFDKSEYKEYKYRDTPDGRYVYLIPCTITKNGFSTKAFIQRIQNVEEKDPNYHPLSIIEIISDVNFRKAWNLKDGDKLVVIV